MANAVRAGEAYIELTSRDGKLIAGLRAAQARLESFSAACRTAGRELLTMATIAAAPLALAVREFAGFDAEMRKVGAIVRATAQDYDMLTAKAREVGRTTSYTATQAAGAMTALGRMGFSPQEIAAATSPVMALARATDTELAPAADIAANTLRIFGKRASEMTNVADVLTATANGSAQTLTDLFEALKVAGPQAAAANEDLTDVCASLGVLANMGIKGSLAGTALRKAYTQFASPKIAALLRSYGVRTADANGNLRKMRDIMVDLAKVMASMPSAEKTAFAQEVFDTRGMTAGLALTADPAQIDKFLESLNNCQGVAKKTQSKMEKGLQGALDKLKSAASDLGLTIAATLLPSIRLLTKGITSAALELQAWIKEHPNWTKALGYTVGAAAALGAALLAIGSAAKVVALGIAGAKLAVTALHAAVAGAAALRTVYTMGVAAMTAANAAYTASCAAGTGAVGAFSAAVAAFMATNPVGWCLLAAGAVAALVYALDQYNTAAPRAARNADDLAAANARQRDEASRQMARLRELSNRYVLTADEMAEARRIAAQLGDQYGDLGIRFDTFAGRVDGARQALARLNDQQKRQEIADIDRQIAERADRIKEAKETNADLNSVWFRVNHPIEHFRGITDAKIHRNNDLIRSFRSQMNLLQQQRQRLTGSSAAPKTSAQANARGRISGQDFLAAQKAAEKIHVPAAPGADSAEKRIAKLQREAEAYDALMETQEKFYRQNGDGKRAAETRAQADAAWNAYMAEIEKIRKQEQEKRAAADQRALDRVAGLDQHFAQAQEAAANRAATARDRQALAFGMANDPRGTVDALKTLVARFEHAASDAVRRYRREREAAVKPDADGRIRITGEEARRMQDARTSYDRSMSSAEHYRALLAQAQENLRASAAGFGGFSVNDIRNLAGGGSAAERTAAAAEQQNMLLQTANRLLQTIANRKETW